MDQVGSQCQLPKAIKWSKFLSLFIFAPVLILALLEACDEGQREENKERNLPNVIFILADDLGIGDVGCYGQQFFKTPNIDLLAAEGMRFINHYSGAPVCAPSRCALITGKHTGHASIRQNHSQIGQGRVSLSSSDFTIGMLAKEAGYATAVFGKWGVGEDGTDGIPNRRGFDEFFGYLNNDHSEFYFTDFLYENQDTLWIEENRDGQKKQYTHDLFTAWAKKFIVEHSDIPFFLYLPYTIPHDLYQVPGEDSQPFFGSFITDGKAEYDSVRSIYAGMITRMDRHVGEIMALLKETGIDEKTLVLFSSDNGAVRPNVFGGDYFNSHGIYRGQKSDLYEGGIRTPLIARWPVKIQAGSTTAHVSAFWDFMPTLAEIAGVLHPDTDGISYLPALMGKNNQQSHDYLYWEYTRKGVASQAARIGNMKVIRNDGINSPIEVYDLVKDPGEQNNVADTHPEVVSRGIEVFIEAHEDNRHYPIDKIN